MPQNEKELRRSGGCGMLKGDPLMRGAMLALPIIALWRAENSFLRMRRTSDAQQGAACS